MIKFLEETHKYISIDETDTRKWFSASSILGFVKNEFDTDTVAANCAVDKGSKWYGLTAEEIKELWKKENKRATDMGKWYHANKEAEAGTENASPIIDGWKYALPQKLKPGVYPEFITYNEEWNICGQVDRIEVRKDNTFNIIDYKTNKTFTNTSEYRLHHPLQYMRSCHYNLYALQLTVYAFMILKHNPQLRLGRLILKHVTFAVKRRDKYGFPIFYADKHIESVVEIPVPFMLNPLALVLKHNHKILRPNDTGYNSELHPIFV